MEKSGMLDISAELLDAVAGVREYANRERAIRMSGELSPTGKNAKLEQLARERQAKRASVVRAAITAYDGLLSRFEANDRRRKAAQNDEAARWDYERLNYEARAAEAKVKGASSIQELTAFYNEALNSGDKHALRAFCEIAASAIRTRGGLFDSKEAALLAGKMERDVLKLRTSPELQACADKGAALADEARELKVILNQLRDFYGGAVSGALGLSIDDELSWMLNSIHENARMLENGAMVYDIEMLPWRDERARITGVIVNNQ